MHWLSFDLRCESGTHIYIYIHAWRSSYELQSKIKPIVIVITIMLYVIFMQFILTFLPAVIKGQIVTMEPLLTDSLN